MLSNAGLLEGRPGLDVMWAGSINDTCLSDFTLGSLHSNTRYMIHTHICQCMMLRLLENVNEQSVGMILSLSVSLSQHWIDANLNYTEH